MDDEAPPHGGLDARGGLRRSRWGRRTPYGLRRDGPRRDDWPAVHDSQGATYAALDLGTNNCRLLIARPTGHGFRVIGELRALGHGPAIWRMWREPQPRA